MSHARRREEAEVSRRADKGAGKARGAEAAARVYLRKNLGWLRGFPSGQAAGSGVPWMTLPRLDGPDRREELAVTRELLRRSEFCRNAAPRKFPRALERVVGDVDEWSAQIEARLRLLKGAVHQGEAPPSLERLVDAAGLRRFIVSRISALVKRRAGLRPVATGLVWLHWGDEAAFAAALRALEEHAAALESVAARLEGPEGVALSLHCVELLVDGCGGGLLGLLADARSWEVPLSNGELHLRLKKSLHVLTDQDLDENLRALSGGFERPKARLAPDLVEFAFSLGGEEKPARLRRLQFLQALGPEKTLEDWADWWAKYDLYERQARKLLNESRQWLSRQSSKRLQALGEEVKSGLSSSLPLWRRVAHFLKTPVFAAGSSKAFASLFACLGLLSGDWKGRPLAEIFLQAWAGAFDSPARGWGVIEQLLAAQQGLLEKAGASSPAKQAWICDYASDELIEIWIGRGKPQRLIAPFAEALGLLVSGQGKETPNGFTGPFLDYTGWDALLAAVDFTGSPPKAAEMLSKAQPMAGGVHGRAWDVLLRLSGGSADRFEALIGNSPSRGWTDAAASELAVLTKEPRVAELAVESLLGGAAQTLHRIVMRSALEKALTPGARGEAQADGPCFTGGEPFAPLELAAYPAELHDLLRELARLDPNAPRTADSILSQDYPLPSRIEAELSFLREALKQSDGARKNSLAARIAGLEGRLAAPPRPPGSRLGKYRMKLERRMRQLRLEAWEASVTRRLRAGLEAKLGTPPPEDWLRDEEIMEVLSALAGLPAGFRELAFRLLKARCGPEPWDLRDEGPNRAFIAQIERGGIDPRPWLDGLGAREIEGAPEPLWLDLEKDPLQIMRMGGCFDTCLSPGAFNFFSAVSNAADINKRVLYARDRWGAVRGRCLLALTNEGGLLTFRVYAHAHLEVIAKAVTEYVFALAEAMGTTVSAGEDVKRLVAAHWYDDGSVDLSGRLTFLRHDSEFVKTLGALPASELFAELERRLGRGGVAPSVIHALAEIEAFRQRPELGVALAEHLGPSFPLDGYSRLTLIGLLRKAGKTQAALAMIEPLVGAVLKADFHLQTWVALELIELGEPHRALRLIRRGRRATVKDWSEDSTDRVSAAAKALEALGRPRQALELYRIASADGDNDAAIRAAELANRLGAADDG